MFSSIINLFRRPWSDDLRVEIRAHGGGVSWITREYQNRTWSTGGGGRQTAYMPTERHPLPGENLPADKDAALSVVAASLAAAGWTVGEWTVTCGLEVLPLDEWLEKHGRWGHYVVTQAQLTRATA